MDPEGSAKGLFLTGTPHPLSHPGARVRCVSLPLGGCSWLWSFDAGRCCWCLSCGAPRLLPPGVFLSFGAPGLLPALGCSSSSLQWVCWRLSFGAVGLLLSLPLGGCGLHVSYRPLCGFRSWLVLLSVCLSFSGCGWCLFLLDALGLLGVSVPFGGRGWCLSFRPPGLPLTLWCSAFFWLLWLVFVCLALWGFCRPWDVSVCLLVPWGFCPARAHDVSLFPLVAAAGICVFCSWLLLRLAFQVFLLLLLLLLLCLSLLPLLFLLSLSSSDPSLSFSVSSFSGLSSSLSVCALWSLSGFPWQVCGLPLCLVWSAPPVIVLLLFLFCP